MERKPRGCVEEKRTSGVVARGHRGKGAQGVSPPKAPERQADLSARTHTSFPLTLIPERP